MSIDHKKLLGKGSDVVDMMGDAGTENNCNRMIDLLMDRGYIEIDQRDGGWWFDEPSDEVWSELEREATSDYTLTD